MYLPPNPTTLIQPMDKGVIISAKRHYQRGFLDEVMVVQEDEEENMLDTDTWDKWTLKNLHSYGSKSAIYNWAGAWKNKTIEISWSHLLRGTEVDCNFLGSKVNNIHTRFHESDDAVDVDDVREWSDNDCGDPRYQCLSDIKTAAVSSGYIAR